MVNIFTNKNILFKTKEEIKSDISKNFLITKSNSFFEKSGDIINFNQNLEISSNGIIITSQYAINSIKIENINKNTELLVIGNALFEKINILNFDNISVYKNVEDLMKNINMKKKYIYPRGEIVTYDISSKFNNVSDFISYKIVYSKKLSDKCIEIIKKSNQNIFIFSYFNTVNFIEIAKKDIETKILKDCKFFIPSIKCKDFLVKEGFKNFEIFNIN